ncbi:MAG: Zn-dependent protease [Acidimicrobiia bacterium]|nr:MAG: Zn-dependent protease [Acidimicrobiia bacterium]
MLGALGAVAALVLFVLAHEAGHYFAAKATGMKVTEFFLGFGPRIWSFRRGETEYGIKPILLGAYVKVVGMSALEEVPPEDESRTYRGKPFWAKTLVVLSGVGANFLIAYLIFFGLVLYQGVPEPTTTIGDVVAVSEGRPTAAAQAGLQPGDRIVAIDGEPTSEWEDVASTLAGNPGEAVVLTIDRSGRTLQLEVTLGERIDPDGRRIGFLGVAPRVENRPAGIGEAAGLAGLQVVDGVRFTFASFFELLQLDNIARLFQGLLGGEVPTEVRPVSVVGVVQLGAQASDLGLANFLYLLGAVNVILGTLNGLPLYPLDGGHFAVALYEKVTGRQADVRMLIPVAVMVIGLISLIGVVAIVLDIVNPIRL